MILDIGMSILLLVSIFYSWKLSSKIKELRKNHEQFHQLVSKLDRAILSAESSISELKSISAYSTLEIQKKIDSANVIADDLEFITDRAINQIKKLENLTQMHVKETSSFIDEKQPETIVKEDRTEAIKEILDRISNIKKKPMKRNLQSSIEFEGEEF